MAITVLAPKGRDAELLSSVGRRGSTDVRVARDARALAVRLDEGAVGALVITQEGIVPEVIDALARRGTNAPPWDRLPVLLLVDAKGNTTAALAAMRKALPDAQLSVMQRPVRLSEFGSAIDMLARARARQLEVRDLLERERALRRELNHRVKNILGTVRALYALSSRRAAGAEAFHASFSGRLETMGRVHDTLFAAGYDRTDLDGLLRDVLEPYRTEADRIGIEGGTIEAAAEAAQGIAMCVHELATNAVKYGALGRTGGELTVRWSVQGEDFALEWRERTDGAATEPGRRGFGHAFLTGTMRSLNGEAALLFDEAGFTARLSAPMDAVRGEHA